jgi:subtilisin-like proprotein convertase family protein
MSKRAGRHFSSARRHQRWSSLASIAVVAVLASALAWVAPTPAGADTTTGTNPATITIPAVGPGSLYPSPITISGMTGTVTDVNLTLNGMQHNVATDVDVLLVGPTGRSIIVMSDAKGNSGFPINAGSSVTFDDQATATIPTTGALTTGSFKPTNENTGADSFPAPAPTPGPDTTLAGAFNGTNPNGVWNLYVVDDTAGDSGTIANGWSITIVTGAVAQPGQIEFTATEFRGAEGGGPVTLTLRRLGGSDGAVGVTIATTTPATATPGIDFTPLSQTVSFADGQTTASVPLTILNDTAVEGIDETLTVALSAPTGGATLGAQTTTVVRIDDNDALSDATPIQIPPPARALDPSATAAPYPASIHVSGQTFNIGRVDVIINALSHQVPVDVDMLLTGPNGQNVVLMSDVGGTASAGPVNLTFSDTAAGQIPAAGPLTTGSFRPSDADPAGQVDTWPAPAPAPSTATTLGGFVGASPNGVWNLFIVDDAGADTGQIANGWSLTFFPQVIPDAGGPYTITEGQSLALNATGTSARATATYAWDLDGDGQFDDATGPSPTITAPGLATLGLGDGPAGPRTITVQVTDGPTTATDTSTVTLTNAPPTASVTSTPPGPVATIPGAYSFAAVDPAAADNAAGFTYAVTWGDGTAVQTVTGGASVTLMHTYASAGTFTLSVTATDKDAGTSAPATASVPVAPLVVADAGGPYTIDEGDDLALSATGSTAGPTASYAWDLDNDGQFDDATGATPTVTPAQRNALGINDGPSGPLTIGVQITEGVSVDTDTATLTVDNAPPTAAIVLPPTIVQGTAASFTFSATDPSAADTAAGFTYTIDWGDGTGPQSVTGGASVSVSHTYSTGGTFTVSVTATDKDAGQSAATATANVQVLVVAEAGGPYTIDEGSGVTLDGTASIAPAGAAFAWDVDGDGQFDDATGANPTLSPAQLAAIGLGDGPAGPVTVTLQVTSGTASDTDATTLTVNNVAPVAAVVDVPLDVTPGIPAALTFGATDASAADTAAGFTYTIDWGDGTGPQSVTGGATVVVQHTYATDGVFTVSVTATDKDGGTSAAATDTVATVVPFVQADAGGPYTIDEGSPLTLDATGTTAGPTATYAWDLDNDGQFDDATGPMPTVPAATLATLGLADGPATVDIFVQVTERVTVEQDDAQLTIDNLPPTVTSSGAPAGPVATGQTVNLQFTGQDASPVDMAAGFTFTVDFGDGTPVLTSAPGSAAVSVAHAFASPGTFTVSATATDKDAGVSAPATVTIDVVAATVADVGGPYTLAEGSDLALDGSASTGSGPLTFAWDVDGDGQFDDATGATPTVPAATLAILGLADGPATRTVAVQVSDGLSTATDTTALTIDNVAPAVTVDVGAPATVVLGTAINPSFSGHDVSPVDQQAGFTFTIDLGDGSGPTSTGPGQLTVGVATTYATTGTFTMSVTATDKDGAVSAPATVTVTVIPLVVADAGGPYTIAEGSDLTLDASGSTAGPTATFAWDLDGDGQFDDATGVSPVLTPTDLDAVGLADGPTTATLTLRVTEGPTVDTATADYSITNVAPTATIALVTPLVAGSPSTIKVGANDPSPADMAAQFEYRIDWEGDGVIDDVVTGPADPPVTHTYASAGDVGLVVIAVDKDGAASTPTVSIVTVSPAAPTGQPTTTTTPGTGGGSGGTRGLGRSVTGSLPFTGTDVVGLVLVAAGLVGLGVLLVVTRQKLAGSRREKFSKKKNSTTRNTGSPTA